MDKKFEEYIVEFKTQIRNKIIALSFEERENEKVKDLIEFVFEYKRFEVQEERKNNNIVRQGERCIGIRTNGRPCSRRRKKNSQYCGTHTQPLDTTENTQDCDDGHDVDDDSHHLKVSKSSITNIDLNAEEVQGIVYYIDKDGNVYHPEDVMKQTEAPRIIARVKPNSKDNIYDKFEWLMPSLNPYL
jgi:hypothetical protein